MSKRDLAWMIAGVLILGIFLGVALSCAVYIHNAKAEDAPVYYCWVMCQPDSEVLLRERPDRKSSVVGALGSGAMVATDGEERNGWVHLTDIYNETGEGWIHGGYVVYSEARKDGHRYCVRSNGRVACRRYINGAKRCWIDNDEELTVYLVSTEWCVTDKGFVKTSYIDFGSRTDIQNMDPDEMTWEDD